MDDEVVVEMLCCAMRRAALGPPIVLPHGFQKRLLAEVRLEMAEHWLDRRGRPD